MDPTLYPLYPLGLPLGPPLDVLGLLLDLPLDPLSPHWIRPSTPAFPWTPWAYPWVSPRSAPGPTPGPLDTLDTLDPPPRLLVDHLSTTHL